MDCSLPDYSVSGIFQARIREWIAVPFSRGSFQPRDWPGLLHCIHILYRLSHQGSLMFVQWGTFNEGVLGGAVLENACIPHTPEKPDKRSHLNFFSPFNFMSLGNLPCLSLFQDMVWQLTLFVLSMCLPDKSFSSVSLGLYSHSRVVCLLHSNHASLLPFPAFCLPLSLPLEPSLSFLLLFLEWKTS